MEEEGKEGKAKRIGFFISIEKNKFGPIKNFKLAGETEKANRYSYTTMIKGGEAEKSFWIPKKLVFNQTPKTLGISRLWVPDAIINDLSVAHFILANQKEDKE